MNLKFLSLWTCCYSASKNPDNLKICLSDLIVLLLFFHSFIFFCLLLPPAAVCFKSTPQCTAPKNDATRRNLFFSINKNTVKHFLFFSFIFHLFTISSIFFSFRLSRKDKQFKLYTKKEKIVKNKTKNLSSKQKKQFF